MPVASPTAPASPMPPASGAERPDMAPDDGGAPADRFPIPLGRIRVLGRPTRLRPAAPDRPPGTGPSAPDRSGGTGPARTRPVTPGRLTLRPAAPPPAGPRHAQPEPESDVDTMPVPPESTSLRRGLWAWLPIGGLALGLLTAVVVATTAPVPLRIAAVVLFACLGPGAAIVSHLRPTDAVTTTALTVIASLTTFIAVATVAVWLHRWAPAATVVGLAGLVALSCVVAVVRRWRRPTLTRQSARHADPAVRDTSVVGTREPTPAWRWSVDALIVVLALAAWTYALNRTDVRGVGSFGLLAVVAPLFFVAPVLCVIGFVAELARGGRRTSVLVAYLGVLLLVIHATTPLLLAEPQYAWTYKHIGVIEYLAGHGGVVGGDIYLQWPAFFAAAAQLGGAGGVNGLQLAPWAPLFFNVVGAVVLFAIARTLSPDRRVAFGTVFGFECVNWIEEDYLAPQGLAFVLSLAVIYLVLRYLRVQPAGGGRLRRWLRQGSPPVPEVSPAARYTAIGGIVAVLAVMSAAHQLSPYLAAISVVALVVFGLVRPWWIALIVVAIPVAYLVPRFSFVAGSFGIFDGMNLFRNAGGNADAWGTVGQAFSAVTVRALALTVWFIVAIAVYRYRRSIGALLVPLILAIVPFGLVLVQSYGGEAIYRVFLFSAPWCAFLIADLGGRLRWPGRVKAAVASVALILAALATMQGRHGQLTNDQQSAESVAAAQYLYAHAEPGATVVLAAPDFPSRLSSNYGTFNTTVPVGEPDLVKGAGLKNVTFYGEYLPAIESFTRSFNGTTAYLVVSNEMANYTTYFGYEPPGAMTNLRNTLNNAPQWTVFYRNPDVTIYQLH